MAVAATGESIRAPAAPAARSRAAVRLWLYVLAALVVAMVAVGGATRLTGSGLSITEWRPVTGVVPPLSEAAWSAMVPYLREQLTVARRFEGPTVFDWLVEVIESNQEYILLRLE